MIFLSGFLFFVIWNTADTSYLSFKKNVDISSSYHGSIGDRVTDGNDYSVHSPSCFHSKSNSEEWLKIDLTKEYRVTKVTIINRVQSSSSSHTRLADAEVRIGNNYELLRDAAKCGTSVTTEQIETSAIIDLLCGESISGRYLMLWHPVRSDFLNVCEIRVYNEDETEISECSVNDRKTDYRGLVSITANGRRCQVWTANTPHVPHSVAAATPENGVGDHNCCRNPDSEDGGAWCYTTDPDVRWEYCNVPDVGTSCPLSPIVNDITAVDVFELDRNCLDFWFASKETLYTSKVLETDCETIQPVNEVVTLDGQSFDNEVTAFTLALYIYTEDSSSAEVLSTSGNTDIRIERTYTNGQLFHSEITVFYGDQQLTRAHVLLPAVWTFLAVTFDGSIKEVKLWRDGEIASIGYTNFQTMSLDFSELQLGSANEDLLAKVAMLQVYDKALNEAEMKAARDKIFENWLLDGSAEFVNVGASYSLTGTEIYQGSQTTLVACSQKCLQMACCDGFSFEIPNSCVVLSQSEVVDRQPVDSAVNYYQKNLKIYPVTRHC